jgi:hypothetical protein
VKNQYFGDINDYRKYGLLRLLTNRGEIKTAVCWMLTADDGRGDGGFIGYVEQRRKWRNFDAPLFDRLHELVLTQNLRDVRGAETSSVLPASRFAPGFLPDDSDGRARYFDAFVDLARGCELVFFDPDNGIEVKSKPYGRKDSSKFLYWREIERLWSAGHSLLIYQHFPRVKRDAFVENKAHQLTERTHAPEIISFRTSRVVFFLVPQADRLEFFEERSEEVETVWKRQILVGRHRR